MVDWLIDDIYLIPGRQSEQQSGYWPGLWSAWGPAPGVSVHRPILQSKSSSASWVSWQLSSHSDSSMLKLQAPGKPKMCSARGREMKETRSSKFLLLHNEGDPFHRFRGKPISHFHSPQSISSDSSAQSALLSHTRWDSMQWPLRHTKSVTAGQLTGSTTSKTHTHTHTHTSEEIWGTCNYEQFNLFFFWTGNHVPLFLQMDLGKCCNEQLCPIKAFLSCVEKTVNKSRRRRCQRTQSLVSAAPPCLRHAREEGKEIRWSADGTYNCIMCVCVCVCVCALW